MQSKTVEKQDCQYNKVNGTSPVGSLAFSLKLYPTQKSKKTLPSKEPHIQQQRHQHRTDHLVSHQMVYVLGCRDVFFQWVTACDGGCAFNGSRPMTEVVEVPKVSKNPFQLVKTKHHSTCMSLSPVISELHQAAKSQNQSF